MVHVQKCIWDNLQKTQWTPKLVFRQFSTVSTLNVLTCELLLICPGVEKLGKYSRIAVLCNNLGRFHMIFALLLQ